MIPKFIHLGCEVSVNGNFVTIRKPDGSRETLTLYLTRYPTHAGSVEQFLRDYIDMKFGEELVTV